MNGLISGLNILIAKWQPIFKNEEAYYNLEISSRIIGYVAKENDKYVFRLKKMPRKQKKQIKRRYRQ